ncbi:MAG: SEL1-like repeat protein [Gammaproteobacteria bacterium]|nr:SEL1-like repeat protein [Gammaproteobacteria bacterium]MBU6509912.1 SEL1-like repeat protein [Gammaproteobacteria bacterium]MDE1984076.1 SEL1-like repeat protein [Gammaproteobacteria bacterium]MDE2108788.1 SEL1-like repeat protein [Gammaproteobacteria bacterium]
MNATPDSALLEAAKAGDPRAQTRVAIGLFSGGQHAEALPWLERAAAQDVPEACNLLALMYLNGIGVPQLPDKAVAYLERAAERGLKEAHYTLGNLLFNGIGTRPDSIRACAHLLKAAELQHWPALRTLGMLHCLASPAPARDATALHCLRLAAQGGDALSQYMLATQLLPQPSAAEQAEGGYWLQQAAGRQVHCAVMRLQRLNMESGREQRQAAAPAFRPEPVTHRHAALSVPDLEALGQNKSAVLEVKVPDTVWQINHVLPPLMCEHFMNLARPALTPSYVADPDTGKLLTNDVRTSSSMFLQLSMYDFIAGLALRRIAGLAGHDVEQAEPLAVLRYLPGQEYKPHYDYFVSRGNREELVDGRGGQRQTTLFVYLNDVEEGGETEFPLLHSAVTPAQGRAVKFLNLDAHGDPNRQTLHAGKPVIRGEKWLLTVWFRQRRFVWGELKNGLST